MLTDETLSNNGHEDREEEALMDTLDMPRCIHHEELSHLISNLSQGGEKCAARAVKLFDFYLEQPFLLDPYIKGFVRGLVAGINDHGRDSSPNWDVVSNFCRVLYSLCKIRGEKAVTVYFKHSVDDVVPTMLFSLKSLETDLGPDGWMVRYVTILMSSVAVLIPFDLNCFKRRLLDAGRPDAFQDLNAVIQTKLTCSGRERQAAVVYMASLFKRKDFAAEFRQFLQEANERVKSDPGSSIGALECIAKVVASLPPSDTKVYCAELLDLMNNLDTSNKSGGSMLRKCRIKLYKRLTCILEINQCLEQLLAALSDSDTIVRLAAAKGVGEICKLVTLESKQRVIEALLDSLTENVESFVPDVNFCHGSSFALAEMLRAGTIPREHLDHAIRIICRLLRFEVPRGRFAIGSAVRDSACYMVWSMVRSYPSKGLNVGNLAGQLICTALFDREVSCRRAAAAAFQELVGRWDRVPSGINIFNLVNFFNVSQKRTTFESLAIQVVTTAPEYKSYIIDHIFNQSINSWDREIRQLGANLLPQILDDPSLLIDELLERAVNLNEIGAQHGAILTLASIVKSVTDQQIIDKIGLISLGLVDFIPPKMLGWELLASVVCLLIARLADNSSCSSKYLGKWLQSCNLALQSRDDVLHAIVANETLPCIVSSMPEGTSEIATYFRGTVLPAADKDRNVNAQRGFTLAIGSMPTWLFVERFGPLSKLLLKIATTKAPLNIIEKRVNAINSLGALYRRLECIPDPQVHLETVTVVMSCLEDYSIDSRGDIGSVIRLAAMKQLPFIFKTREDEFVDRYFGKLLLHMVDKLDKLRLEAVTLLESHLKSRECGPSHSEYNPKRNPGSQLPNIPWDKLRDNDFNPKCNLRDQDCQLASIPWDRLRDNDSNQKCNPRDQDCQLPNIPWDKLRDNNFNPKEFFKILSDFDLSSTVFWEDVLTGLISSAGSADPSLELLVCWIDRGYLHGEKLMALLGRCFQRMKRAVVHLLDRLLLRGVKIAIPNLLIESIGSLASDTRTNMQDILVATRLLIKLAPDNDIAASWVKASENHEFARVREFCQSSQSPDIGA